MSIELVLFYFLAGLALLSAIMVIGSSNPVHSVLFLILVFFNSTGLFLLLEVEFIAMIILMVYVGAVAVLFLFVVMMLNVRISELNESLIRYLPIGGLIGLIFFFQLFLIIENHFIPLNTNSYSSNLNIDWIDLMNQNNNLKSIGQILYTNYSYFFIISGMILLVAMVGAIVLTMYKRANVKRQDIFVQLTRDFEKVIYLKN